MKKFLGFLLIIGVLTLTACGGGGGDDGPDENSAPVANAGPDQNISTGSTVNLNGGGFDANGDLLNYSWSFTSKPAGSNATLSNLTVSNPTFSADLDGTYILSLVVNDGTETSLFDSVTITAATSNSAPVAAAGNDQSVVVGTLVNLDGSASSDANSDLLTYTWEITSKPAGSSSSLSSTTIVSPTFTADVAGAYVLSLIVNDGKVNSSVGSVTITATVANAAPVANAGTNQDVLTSIFVEERGLITLDGSASNDANGDQLTYVWGFTSKPFGSSATLLNNNLINPVFYPDFEGAYVFNLVVNDGEVNSNVAIVTITVAFANEAPVANAGTAQTVVIGDEVILNGNASSDPNGDSLTYSWELTSAPDGSISSISNVTSVSPSFIPDLPGIYNLILTVSDSEFSTTSSVNITVLDVVSSHLTIYTESYYAEGLSLCNFQDVSVGYFGFIWTFTDCRIFGNAGNKLTFTLRNNTNNYYNIEYSWLYSGFNNQYALQNTILSPNETRIANMILPIGGEVTNAYVETKITGLNSIKTYFDINSLKSR